LFGLGFGVRCGGFYGGSSGRVGEEKIAAVFAAGKADGGDPGCTLVDENAKEEEMQQRGAGDVRGAAAVWCDWFADRFDAVLLSLQYFAACLPTMLFRRG
jgi:hypothetical protein